MNLVNHAVKYLSITFLLVLSIWATVFYFNMLDEVYDSIDDGLENYKMLIIARVKDDPTILRRESFDERNYFVQEITEEQAVRIKDTYRDSLIYTLNEEDYEPVRVLTSAFKNDGSYYRLTIMSSMVEEDDLIEDLLFALIILYVSLLVVVVLVNNVVLQKLWKPFYKILHDLRHYKLGKDERIPDTHTNVAEFKELKQAVDTLLQQSTATYNRQKQFVENASHELQTPLAISLNKLELLAEEGSSRPDELKTIKDISDELQRLVRLNKSLLQLTKIENSQFQEISTISINELVKKHLEDFTDFADFRNVSFSYKETEALNVEMNPDLANVLVINLLKNAIIHNVPNGRVAVTIDAKSLMICNSGSTTPLNAEKIFDRFYKDGSNSSSSGLGLAIVKAIAESYGFTVRYSFVETHCFEVSF